MLTPFCLAADMNNTKMFEFILESRKMVQWTYGHVSSNLYPMDELDPLWVRATVAGVGAVVGVVFVVIGGGVKLLFHCV